MEANLDNALKRYQQKVTMTASSTPWLRQILQIKWYNLRFKPKLLIWNRDCISWLVVEMSSVLPHLACRRNGMVSGHQLCHTETICRSGFFSEVGRWVRTILHCEEPKQLMVVVWLKYKLRYYTQTDTLVS